MLSSTSSSRWNQRCRVKRVRPNHDLRFSVARSLRSACPVHSWTKIPTPATPVQKNCAGPTRQLGQLSRLQGEAGQGAHQVGPAARGLAAGDAERGGQHGDREGRVPVAVVADVAEDLAAAERADGRGRDHVRVRREADVQELQPTPNPRLTPRQQLAERGGKDLGLTDPPAPKSSWIPKTSHVVSTFCVMPPIQRLVVHIAMM